MVGEGKPKRGQNFHKGKGLDGARVPGVGVGNENSTPPPREAENKGVGMGKPG